jgi:hypothetical protein
MIAQHSIHTFGQAFAMLNVSTGFLLWLSSHTVAP